VATNGVRVLLRGVVSAPCSSKTPRVEVLGRYSRLTSLACELRSLQGAIASPSAPAPEPAAAHVHKLAHRLDDETVARVVARYEAGVPSAQIAEEVGVSRNGILRILRRAGVVTRYPRIAEAEVREATSLYEAGLSLVEVGRRLDRGHSTIYQALKRAGLPMRDSHGRER